MLQILAKEDFFAKLGYSRNMKKILIIIVSIIAFIGVGISIYF
jgi:hypothetical protein